MSWSGARGQAEPPRAPLPGEWEAGHGQACLFLQHAVTPATPITLHRPGVFQARAKYLCQKSRCSYPHFVQKEIKVEERRRFTSSPALPVLALAEEPIPGGGRGPFRHFPHLGA